MKIIEIFLIVYSIGCAVSYGLNGNIPACAFAIGAGIWIGVNLAQTKEIERLRQIIRDFVEEGR